ncbi:helix-turn-helix domain-containing protein [Bradyrhizobium sp. RT11b]|uniref:helix-turn-helix domain-containing protein n=1 Tax=Bradyrhizobium sp. RT11b TaxID=3156332 RepID=UPI0033990D18
MVRSVVQGGLSKADAAYQFNTTRKTIAKWVERFRRRCEAAHDRSSSPPLTDEPSPATSARSSRRCAGSATLACKSQAKWAVRHHPEDAAELLSC